MAWADNLDAVGEDQQADRSAGEVIAVESPTYFVILQMLHSLGLRAVEIPASERGMDLAQLESALKAGQLRAVISIANINNPTGITLSMEDKSKLVALAERYDVALIEDDIYGDTHFNAIRPRPLRAFSDKVILCSSFSKTLAPGIRVGWVAGGRWSSAIASMKYSSTLGTAIYPQAAIAEFLRTGGYDAHLRKLRHTLHKQIDSLPGRRPVVGMPHPVVRHQRGIAHLRSMPDAPSSRKHPRTTVQAARLPTTQAQPPASRAVDTAKRLAT